MKNRPSYKINYNGILKCLPYSRFQKSAANKYLLLAEFSVHTVNYGPSFFPLIYALSAKRASHKSLEKTEDP